MLEIRNLSVSAGDLEILKGVDLTVNSGEVHAIMGPNGSGKTTVLSILSGLRRKTSGTITFGVPPNKVMLMPDTPDFFGFLTTREVVDMARFPFRGQVAKESVEQVIEEVGLSESIDRRVGGFSRGMKQRLGLATTMISAPEVLLLDEPCSALDPLGRREVLDLVSRLKNRATVLFSTHILSDIESVCDSVTVVDHGRALYEGPVDAIGKSPNETFEDAVLKLLQPDRGER